MRNLIECKEYFKDLFITCLSVNAFEKNIFECVELARYETFCDVLKFIFGEEFNKIKPHWVKEASTEFYSI